jgi:PAS domain S-box-containing protein
MLDSLSMQARFLITPLIGVLLTLVVYLGANQIIQSNNLLLEMINETNLAQVSEINEIKLRISSINSDLVTLLLEPAELDEEEIYVEGKKKLNELHKVQQRLHENLHEKAKLIINGRDVYQQFESLLSAYILQAISAVEMSSVNRAKASSELSLANKKLKPLNELFLEISNFQLGTLSRQGVLVERSLYKKSYITELTIGLLLLMLWFAFFFSRKSSAALDRLRIEQENIAKELTQFIDTANAPIFGINTEGKINEWNQQSEKITGFTKSEVMGEDLVANFITDEYKLAVRQVLQKALNGEETANYEFPLFTKSGDISVDVLLNSTTRRDAAGQIVGVVGVGQDITELNSVRIEQANIAKELTQFIDTANAPIFGIDARGKVNEWNQQAEKITGFTKSEVMGKDLVANFITDEYKLAVGEVLQKALNGEETANYEFPLFTKSGDISVDVLLNSTTRRDAAGQIIGVVGVGQDITELNSVRAEQERERKESAAQIIQASKLATLGEMATSVAHELNQPLSIIRMAAGNTRRRMSKNTAGPEYLIDKLERIEEQTSRAAAIIDHMRMFGREATEDPEPIDPRSVVMNALDLMGEQLRLEGISVVTQLAEDCPSVLGHAIQMEQVVLNLLTNARDAMSERDGESKITLRVFSDHKGVHIISEDTGGGIAEEALPRIFEPFYTTKEMGKGTGLGLSVGYGIVRDMDGTIRAENIGDGARFSITLPFGS